MDALTSLLDGPRARRAFLLRTVLEPPWSIRVQDEAPLSLTAMVRGRAWVVPDEGPPVGMGPGAVAIMRGPEPYVVADHPDTPPQVVIHPGQRCTTPSGEPLSDAMWLGMRTWGNAAEGGDVMLVGTYPARSDVSDRLLAALPPLLVLSTDSLDTPLVGLLGAEMVRDAPGGAAVLDRLLDLLLIDVLRVWFSRPEAEAPDWYRALGDPVVGPALRLLHDDPAHPWTVESLATRVGVSRAALARRFAELVGEPPMRYLASWRLALAADLIQEPQATVVSVARRVGYSSAFALSAAFKRVRGVSPQQHRLGVAN